MAHINFVIPQSKSELLRDKDDEYYVKNVSTVKNLVTELKNARQCLKDEGPEFILENFDVFYSVFHHIDSLQLNVVYTAYEYLHKAAQDLNKTLSFLLEDKEGLNDEIKTKYLNIIKMLLYLYGNIVILIEQKNDLHRAQTLSLKVKGRKKSKEDEETFTCDRQSVLLNLIYITQQEISLFWDPPVVDEVFINMVSEVCYRFLESGSIKGDKEALMEIWNMLGLLVKNYNHGVTFVVRLVQLIKMQEHLIACVPEGIQHLVETHHCKSLVRDFVREITEWQVDERFTDSQGSRFCAKVLSELASLMPNLMIPEVLYLNRYLSHESYTLRNSVLNVIMEVVLSALTKQELNDEERESRDDFLAILEEHIQDTSAFVRTKVFQHWGRLQRENAVPIKHQSNILEKAVFHLRDKSAVVRKAAANCVTTFLEHNLYGGNLQLGKIREELMEKTTALSTLKAELDGIEVSKLREIDEEWMKREDDIREAIKRKLQQPTQETPDMEIEKESLSEMIRMYIIEGKYEDAFALCRIAGKNNDEFKNMRDNVENAEEVDLFMVLMRTIFSNIYTHAKELTSSKDNNSSKTNPTEQDLSKLTSLERSVDFLSDLVRFLELIDSAIKPMKDLLDSASSGDMQEAVDFFVASYKFNIDNNLTGVLEILQIMQRGEQDRREIVLKSFKTIYLTTDSKSLIEHTTIVVNRLISLLQFVPFDNFKDLSLIISEWVSKGVLDNSIIDMLWQYFTKKVEVSDAQSRSALNLLTMAAQGRRTIITRNIKLVSTLAFGERGLNDILLVTQACKFLSIAGYEKQDVTNKEPPFKIKACDPIWKELGDIVVTVFDKKIKFVNELITAAIDFIYRLCSTPIKICNTLVKTLLNKISGKNEYEAYIIIRCNHLLGEIAINHLNFLDEVIYKELKRRNYIRDEKKNDKKGHKKKKPAKNTSRLQNTNSSIISNASVLDTESVNGDESVLEGAQADDIDADFISRVLENCTVTENTALGNLAHLIVKVCERPDVYDDEYIQGSSITALLRYMLVSNNFCQKYIVLVFTILEKTTYEDVKITILLHISDLLEKCPNIVEPYTPRLYKILEDQNIMVRKATLFMISNLILRDMIRAQGHISEIARCVADPEEELRDMSKNFFIQLSHKANNLYNVLPDIFSHLCEHTDNERLRTIMRFLFGLVDKNKQMENLVDRFCAKFKLTEDENIAKNIAFCLSLINYNEKGLRKLIDNFQIYKHHVLVNDIFAIFKHITSMFNKASAKNEMKVLAVELDEKMAQMFEITEGAVMPKKTSVPEFKKPKGRAKKKAPLRQNVLSDDDSDEEFQNPLLNSAKKSKKSRLQGRVQRKKTRSDSDSD